MIVNIIGGGLFIVVLLACIAYLITMKKAFSATSD